METDSGQQNFQDSRTASPMLKKLKLVHPQAKVNFLLPPIENKMDNRDDVVFVKTSGRVTQRSQNLKLPSSSDEDSQISLKSRDLGSSLSSKRQNGRLNGSLSSAQVTPNFTCGMRRGFPGPQKLDSNVSLVSKQNTRALPLKKTKTIFNRKPQQKRSVFRQQQDSNSLVTDSVDLSEEEDNSINSDQGKSKGNKAYQRQASSNKIYQTLKLVTQKSYQKKKIEINQTVAKTDIKINRSKERRVSHRRTGHEKSRSSWGDKNEDDLQLMTAAMRFNQYKEQFINMTRRKKISTDYDIIQTIITNDEQHAIILLVISIQQEYEIQIFKLNSETQKPINQIQISGTEVFADHIVQNKEGTQFCLPYIDSGNFKLLSFDATNPQLDLLENINEDLNISTKQQPPTCLTYPLINALFVDKEKLFVNLFDQLSSSNIHFTYCHSEKRIVNPVQTQMDSLDYNQDKSNFPVGLIYDSNKDEVICTYRHGQCLTIKAKQKKQKMKMTRINTKDQTFSNMMVTSPRVGGVDFSNEYSPKTPGYMQPDVQFDQLDCEGLDKTLLIGNRLICRVSGSIVFFKRTMRQFDDENFNEDQQGQFFWKVVHSIDFDDKSQLSRAEGRNEFIITTSKYIYLYIIQLEEIKPKLKNVLYNFMMCDLMITGPKNIYNVTYNHGQPDFIICSRSSYHNFSVYINHDSMVDSVCLSIQMREPAYCISQFNTLVMYRQSDFLEFSRFSIEQDSKIVNIVASKDSKVLALMTEYKSIHIYKNMGKTFEFVDMIDLSGDDELIGLSKCLVFDRSSNESIFFVDQCQIYKLNYAEHSMEDVFQFQYLLEKPPEIFEFNSEQNIVLVVAHEDVVFADLKTQEEVGLDVKYHITDVRACLNCYGKFYIIANKFEKNRGLYLLELDENEPCKKSYPDFIIKSNVSLEIGDANLFTLEATDRNSDHSETKDTRTKIAQALSKLLKSKTSRELVISYKQIYINKYNIIVINLDLHNPKKHRIVFKHQGYHIWESRIQGLLLSVENDYLILSKHGIKAISLANNNGIKDFRDKQAILWKLHSLQTCNYLKVHQTNHLFFKDNLVDNDVMLKIQDQYENEKSNETEFEDIYQILIKQMSLNELLLFQGLFSCPTQSQVAQIVEMQPCVAVFFKSFLELDLCNLISILSFDTKAIQVLLSDVNVCYNQTQFPLFYKIKQQGGQSHSAIDISLQNNQIEALNLMIQYIVKYQNNVVYSYLFEKNFTSLIQKGVNVEPLLQSKLFCHQFDFESWPQFHTNEDTIIMPYNGSIFDLRFNYDKVFPDLAKDEAYQEIARQDVNTKVVKIKYTLNLLPKMGEQNDKLMDMLGDIEENDVFKTKVVQDIIDFKWNKYAKYIHYVGTFLHAIYVILFCSYVNLIYLEDDKTYKIYILGCMMFCLAYAGIYDLTQLYQQGCDYFLDMWNYSDQMHIWGGFLTIYFQFVYEGDSIPRTPECQVTMFISAIMMLIKTFFYLRIFKSLTKLVIMIKKVVNDLTSFLIFFFIQIVIFSVIYGILAVNNYKSPQDENILNMIKLKYDQASTDAFEFDGQQYPGFEYKHLSLFLANIIRTMRFSLGDFEFGSILHLNTFESALFWITWLITVLMTCIVFLNFIIAEVSESYANVQESVEELILKEQASLINESEDMMLERWKNDDKKFPRYLIMREVEK